MKEWTPTWWVEATDVLWWSRHGVGVRVDSRRRPRGVGTRKTRENRIGIGSRILMKHHWVQVWTRVTVWVISCAWPSCKCNTNQSLKNVQQQFSAKNNLWYPYALKQTKKLPVPLHKQLVFNILSTMMVISQQNIWIWMSWMHVLFV